MSDEQVPPAPEEPVAPGTLAAAVPEAIVAEAPPVVDDKVGDCVVCKEHVRVESLSTRELPEGGWGQVIVCSLCSGMRGIASDIKASIESIPRLLKTQIFVVGELVPLLRKAGIVPKLMHAPWSGYVSIRPFDREQGMKLAGALGGLLETKHSWKKEQEYNDAFFKLSGRVQRDDLTIDLVISGVAPSESCTVVYEEIDVPARKEKRAKIVCKEAAPPVSLP